ncbi:MAG TPA: hypothetical protein VHN13_15300 [Candidatus Tectomicrobia bacterium]|nr:hypothetical protein [Candidatus Tectomicrobia bacterium]
MVARALVTVEAMIGAWVDFDTADFAVCVRFGFEPAHFVGRRVPVERAETPQHRAPHVRSAFERGWSFAKGQWDAPAMALVRASASSPV